MLELITGAFSMIYKEMTGSHESDARYDIAGIMKDYDLNFSHSLIWFLALVIVALVILRAIKESEK
jgi:hypothetical protein